MFGTVVERAKATKQRRMVVTESRELAVRWGSQLGSGLQVGWDSLDIPGMDFLAIADSDKVLGKTYDNLVLDLRGSFSANDLGKIIPTIRGGGVIIVLTPNFEKWATSYLSYHEKLAVPPHRIQDCRHLFIPRIIRKLYEHEGIWIHRGGRWEKESLEGFDKPGTGRAKSPRSAPREIAPLLKTQDQADALGCLVKDGGISVLTADRGRGKTALLGLVVASLRVMKDRKTEVVVTAPSRESVSTLFEFLEKGLDALGIPYSYRGNMLLGKRIKVVFEEPREALEKKADLFIIDEAAGLPLALLKQLASKGRVIFSTTVHGYEGAGRTFSVRFLSYLRDLGFEHRTMSEPIRYAPGDPVEKWLFDTLLLDAEPDEIDRLGDLIVEKPSPRELFSDEERLKSFFGLLVSAHYKNTPNDLMTLADAPHHFVRIATTRGRIVGGVQYALEGGLSALESVELFENPRPEGNLVPDVFGKHYGLTGFAGLRGARVVRIVSHPGFFGRGIGSRLLQEISKDADWLGASFGASGKLVGFWLKNGFVPFATSPQRNDVSGEYSLMVVKPLSGEAEEFCDKAREQFSRRFLSALGDIYWDMEPGTALEILRGLAVGGELRLDSLEKKRLDFFVAGKHIYELDVDIISKLVEHYFLSSGDYLSREEELVLVSKVLQKATLKVVKEKTGAEQVYDTVRKAVEKIYRYVF